jgi:hypothetical protein
VDVPCCAIPHMVLHSFTPSSSLSGRSNSVDDCEVGRKSQFLVVRLSVRCCRTRQVVLQFTLSSSPSGATNSTDLGCLSTSNLFQPFFVNLAPTLTKITLITQARQLIWSISSNMVQHTVTYFDGLETPHPQKAMYRISIPCIKFGTLGSCKRN